MLCKPVYVNPEIPMIWVKRETMPCLWSRQFSLLPHSSWWCVLSLPLNQRSSLWRWKQSWRCNLHMREGSDKTEWLTSESWWSWKLKTSKDSLSYSQSLLLTVGYKQQRCRGNLSYSSREGRWWKRFSQAGYGWQTHIQRDWLHAEQGKDLLETLMAYYVKACHVVM